MITSCCLPVGDFFLLSADPGPRQTGLVTIVSEKCATKRMACSKPGYKVRTGVREGRFLPEKEFLKSPSPSFFPKMVGGIKSQHELQSALCQGDRAALLRRHGQVAHPSSARGMGSLSPALRWEGGLKPGWH